LNGGKLPSEIEVPGYPYATPSWKAKVMKLARNVHARMVAQEEQKRQSLKAFEEEAAKKVEAAVKEAEARAKEEAATEAKRVADAEEAKRTEEAAKEEAAQAKEEAPAEAKRTEEAAKEEAAQAKEEAPAEAKNVDSLIDQIAKFNGINIAINPSSLSSLIVALPDVSIDLFNAEPEIERAQDEAQSQNSMNLQGDKVLPHNADNENTPVQSNNKLALLKNQTVACKDKAHCETIKRDYGDVETQFSLIKRRQGPLITLEDLENRISACNSLKDCKDVESHIEKLSMDNDLEDTFQTIRARITKDINSKVGKFRDMEDLKSRLAACRDEDECSKVKLDLKISALLDSPYNATETLRAWHGALMDMVNLKLSLISDLKEADKCALSKCESIAAKLAKYSDNMTVDTGVKAAMGNMQPNIDQVNANIANRELHNKLRELWIRNHVRERLLKKAVLVGLS
jgi:hypothetical protein